MQPKPDFERYMTALHCEEPDRVPLGDWHVDTLPKERFLGRKVATFQDQVDFGYGRIRFRFRLFGHPRTGPGPGRNDH